MTEDKWVEGFIRSPEIFAPGEDFAYNSTNTFMISAIIQKTTGMKMLDYLNEKLFHPMGIYDLYWEENPEGINKGGWGLSLWIEGPIKTPATRYAVTSGNFSGLTTRVIINPAINATETASIVIIFFPSLQLYLCQAK